MYVASINLDRGLTDCARNNLVGMFLSVHMF